MAYIEYSLHMYQKMDLKQIYGEYIYIYIVYVKFIYRMYLFPEHDIFLLPVSIVIKER